MFRVLLRLSLGITGSLPKRYSKAVNLPSSQHTATSNNQRKLKYPTKVPQAPHVSGLTNGTAPIRIEVDEQTVQLLERLSLVDLDSKEAHKTLEDSIEFASRILAIDTEGVEPFYTVLENQKLSLREDVVSDGNIQSDVLANARITEEEYFVAPPGNIPLDQQDPSGDIPNTKH
ncbi:glutamyl-tRNA(Gln) amidotransferase subunit C, mitochondrial [Topomyia yanbarensis]|uniref:glutamyl-tRNA(Gln) amidotransferase subunit C, mitochondrial n=1 Tax=Topomyia yanbarensis TaxID=2498891 RepID=UPI00273A894C|nr:glutamyl-tRNA(Gln) amidotransferase subunit C, mitochondrial [Topomyia yanbarensis]